MFGVNKNPPIISNSGRIKEESLSEDSKIFLEILEKKKSALQQLASSRNLTDSHLPELMKLRTDAEEFQKRNPVKQAEAQAIAAFAQDSINGIKADCRNQKVMLKSRKDQDDSLSATSLPFRGDSPFSQSSVRRFNGLNLGGDGIDQGRILKELKEFMEKSNNDIHGQLDRMERRLDTMNSDINNRLSQLESNESAVRATQLRCEDSLSSLTRTASRTEDQCTSLSRKVEDLMSIRQQQPSGPPAGPLQVNLNLTGLPSGLTLNTGPGPFPSSEVPGPGSSSNVPKPLLSTVPPVAPSHPNPPLTVNVPVQRPGLLEHPVSKPPVNIVPEAKGSGTVDWSNPSITKGTGSAKPAPSVTAKPQPPLQIATPQKTLATPAPSSSTMPTVEGGKLSLFGGFQGFGTTGAGTLGAGSPFSGSPFSSAGKNAFAALAESSSGGGAFQKSDKPFPGTGTVLFGGASAKPAVPEDDDEDTEATVQEDTFEPNVDFRPLVSLPVVAVKTGEENFEKVFTDRCKLYRFDNSVKEWKERGLGDLSIQRRMDPPVGTVVIRILMRWEKTHKICANHQFTPTMELQRFSEADQKSWKWFANDFSDGELKYDLFGIRFKTKEQADKFKTAFDGAVKEVKEVSVNSLLPAKTATAQTPVPPPAATVGNPAAVPSWSELSKPKTGTWSCKDCYSSNPSDKAACMACGSKNPSAAPSASGPSHLTEILNKPKVDPPTTAFPPFGSSVGGATSGSNTTYPSFAPSTSTFSFGYNTLSNQQQANANPFSGFSLGTNPPPAVAPTASGSLFNFCGSGFDFKLVTKPPSATKKATEHESSGEEENDVEAENQSAIFQPVVKLPDNVVVVTGEEHEIELYSQRAKLYRYADREWKERGLGDIKMMKDRDSNKVRLLMRREKILKVCLNHFIGPGMDLKPMPSTKTAWIWNAQDFAEGVIVHEQFAIKFKYESHWKEFKDLVERCKKIADGTAAFNVNEKFDRVQVNDAEATVPIAESGKKAVEAMAVHNPFADQPTANNPVVEEPDSSVAADPSNEDQIDEGAVEEAAGPSWGDTSYKHFSVIFNGRNEAVAIGIPSLAGFYRLKSPSDIKALIAADAVSEETVRNEIDRLTERINTDDLTTIPEAVRRYYRANKVREYGDDEAWRAVLFERQLTLTKKTGGIFKSIGLGMLRITRDGDYDSPYLVQHFDLKSYQDDFIPRELAVHSVTHDCNFEVDRHRFIAQWTANDYANSERASLHDFLVKFSNQQSLSEFEKVFLDGINVAEEGDISLRSTAN